MRGDHKPTWDDQDRGQGPTPRAQGPPLTLLRGLRNEGTNPACAGTTGRDLRFYAGADLILLTS